MSGKTLPTHLFLRRCPRLCACTYACARLWSAACEAWVWYLLRDKSVIVRGCVTESVCSLEWERTKPSRIPSYNCPHWRLINCITTSTHNTPGLYLEIHFLKRQNRALFILGHGGEEIPSEKVKGGEGRTQNTWGLGIDRHQGPEGCTASRQHMQSPWVGMCPRAQEITRSQCVWCSHWGAESPLRDQKMNSGTTSAGLFLSTLKRLLCTVLGHFYLYISDSRHNNFLILQQNKEERNTSSPYNPSPALYLCLSNAGYCFLFRPVSCAYPWDRPFTVSPPTGLLGRPSVAHADPTQIPFHSAACPPPASLCRATNRLQL